MKTPLSWIKDFVPDLKCTDQEFVDAMTMSGTKCEGYEKLAAAEVYGRDCSQPADNPGILRRRRYTGYEPERHAHPP